MQQCSFENIPDSFLKKWQEIADLLANIIQVPAALIMKAENETMEVFSASKTENNPYNIGDKEHWHGLYCETVIKTQKKLNIPNALKDKNWDKNPDLKLGMLAYLGFPINFPDKTPFGTLCVLDRQERQFTTEQEKILLQFKNTIELDLALIFALELEQTGGQNEVIQNLLSSNEKYQLMHEEYLTTNEELQQANEELQQAKRKAEENEEKYRRIADNVTDVVWITDLEMNPTYISPSVERVYGITPEEYLKRPLSETYPPSSIEKFKQTLTAQFAKEQDPQADKNRTFQLEVERYYADGRIGFDLINATFVRDEQMNPIGIQGVSHDITERFRAEEKLRKKSNLLEKVFNSNFDLIALSDLKGNFILVGKSHEILGYSTDYLIGKNIMDFVHPNDIDNVNKEFVQFLESGDNRKVEYRYKCSNGDYLWFETIGTLLKDDNDNPEQILFNTRNITERKQSEETLRESETRFQKMLGVIPDMISIQNPEMDILYSNSKGFGTVNQRKQVLNTKCYKTYRNLDKQCPDCLAKTVLETRKPIQEEARLPNGKWYDIRVIPILDENNNVEMFMEWVRDITASKQAEEILKSNYALLQIAGESARFGGWSVDLEKNIATWSDAVADIHEVPHRYAPPVEEVINFYAPEWREKITQVFNQCAQKGIPYDEEMEIITAKGKRLWVRANGKAIKDETGKIVKVQGAFQDISERKNAEKALRESEEKMRSIYRVAPTGIGVVVNRELKEVNPRVCHMTGYSREELINKNAQILYPSRKEYDFVGKEKYEQIRKKGTGKVETLWRKKDGTIINVLMASTPIDQNDHSKGVTFTALDITERKQAEEALKESEKRFHHVLRDIPWIAVQGYQFDGTVIYWNKASENLYGYTADEAFGSKLYELIIPPEMRENVRNEIRQMHETLKPAPSAELSLMRKNGSRVSVISSHAIVQRKGHEPELFCLDIDITNRKRAEILLEESYKKIQAQNEDYESVNEELRQTNEELYEAKEKAEESDRLKTAFLQNMSHEIRTPLNAISGFSGMLNKPKLQDEKRKKFVSIIQNSSRQLVAIISDILTISSLDTKQEKLNISKVNINGVIEELFSIFKPEAQKQNISLKVKNSLANSQSVVYVDKTKVTQIFTNLLSNALKFTHEGFIELGYNVKNDSEPAEMEFYVKDSGIGMTPNQQKIIFERFQQAHKSINKLYGGTGLGLSISKGFAEMMGGKIWVESKPNEGSTFYFTLPFKTANKKDKVKPQALQNKTAGTILVAEDEELNFVLIQEYLTSLNVSLIHAKDGQETVDICKENPDINLVLMDIKMPKITGDEAAKIIKQFKPGLPIVAQSAYVQEHDIKRFSNIFDAYLAKPITEEVLKQTVNKFITISKE
ncbi:PAS domain S-box protein [Salinivirga cyanobacteriivorans]